MTAGDNDRVEAVVAQRQYPEIGGEAASQILQALHHGVGIQELQNVRDRADRKRAAAQKEERLMGQDSPLCDPPKCKQKNTDDDDRSNHIPNQSGRQIDFQQGRDAVHNPKHDRRGDRLENGSALARHYHKQQACQKRGIFHEACNDQREGQPFCEKHLKRYT